MTPEKGKNEKTAAGSADEKRPRPAGKGEKTAEGCRLPSPKRNARYGLACVTSMGVRITPAGSMQVQGSEWFRMQSTSAETNVLNVSSSLGIPCLALTAFVAGSPIASFIKSRLRARGIDFTGPDKEQGGPWGYRHQFNIADTGAGLRAPRVWNDRSGEVGREISASDYDLRKIFAEDGVSVLHLSGLIAALSEKTTAACVGIAEYAKSCGTLLSFDLNYRASFWKGRESELREAFERIAGIADILIGNEEDFQLCLGFDGPETGGNGIADKIGGFEEMISRVSEKYPGASVYATALRSVISAEEHLWGALVRAGGKWYVEEPRSIRVTDRIGGGDGFAGGLLYAILRGYAPEDWMKYAWSAGALAASSLNDYAEPADEKQLLDIYGGNARVIR